MLKSYIQYQKPQIYMLYALSLPLVGGIYNFGWRSLLAVAVSCFACWATEYTFTKREKKPASAASLVTGVLIALIIPPNVPFWQIIVGAVFAIIFGKMAFGGFGRNIFNPAMVARCFLYICFPATIAATWYVPFQGGAGGFTHYTTTTKTREVEADLYSPDGITSATTFAITKRLNQIAREALENKDQAGYDKALQAYRSIPLSRLFTGNINGSTGETYTWLILISMAFLLHQKIIFVPLVVGPLIGLAITKIFMKIIGVDVMPFWDGYMVGLLAGSTVFSITFMTTEPITAPTNNKARWIYATLIGIFAGLIRAMSAFNAGIMFSILLANTFGPLIEQGCELYDKPRKVKSE